MNIRERKQHLVDLIKEELRQSAASTAMIAERHGISMKTAKQCIDRITGADGRIFVEGREMKNGVWVKHYRYGVGEDVDAPKPDAMTAGQRAYQRLLQDPAKVAAKNARRHLSRTRAKQGLPPEIRRGRPAVRVKDVLTPEQIEERNEQIAQQREQYRRAARLAAIKPHKDPYAWFMFGGAKQLAGVRAW
jgi:hypothetical protein